MLRPLPFRRVGPRPARADAPLRGHHSRTSDTGRWLAGLLLLAVTLAAGCNNARAPRPLVLGEDACATCRMAITDPRYGGEVRTTTGRVHTFDAVECLASYVAVADSAALAGVWVVDFDGGGMLPAAEARYLRGGSLHSPMGRQLTAFAPTRTHAELVAAYGGTPASWSDVLAEARSAAHGSRADSASAMQH